MGHVAIRGKGKGDERHNSLECPRLTARIPSYALESIVASVNEARLECGRGLLFDRVLTSKGGLT